MKSRLYQIATSSLAIITLLVPIASYGQVGTGPNPYSDCGIGAAIFPNNSALAATSNVIWDVGTTAVISATASPQTCQGSNAQTAQFILDTYDNIIEETAKGSGQHLTAMLNILGCSENSHAQILSNVRSKIAGSVTAVSYTEITQLEKASQYYDSLMVASANSCS